MPRMYLFAVLGLLAACGAPDSASEKGVAPEALSGPSMSGPSPGDLGCPEGLASFKIDAPRGRRYPLEDGTISVWLAIERTAEGELLSWSSSRGVDAVIVKGGNAAEFYRYGPEAQEGSGLHSPRNASGGYADVSHVTFCYDLEVEARQEGRTSMKRAYHWTVEKTGSLASVELPAGGTATVSYDVTVGLATVPFTDSDWRLDGELTVSNPTPVAASLTGVSVVVTGDIVASVECPAAITPDSPYTLSPGATLVCRYSTGLPDGSPRGATATITTQGPVLGGENVASIDFSGAAFEAIDECIDVDDSLTGPLAGGALLPVCVGHPLPKAFSYTRVLGPYAVSQCGQHTVDNVATFRAHDTGATGSASWPVAIQVPCPPPPGGGQPRLALDIASYQVWQQDCAGLLDLTDGVLRLQNTGQATATVQSILFSATFKVGSQEFNIAGGEAFDCGARTWPVMAPGQQAWVTFGCGNIFPVSATEVRLTAHVRIAGQEQVYTLSRSVAVR